MFVKKLLVVASVLVGAVAAVREDEEMCCKGECEVGWLQEGRWRHHPLQGNSRRTKCRVPAALVREWLRAAGW